MSAQSAVLMDADTGRILYEKNPHERSLIASTTKIMTALVVLENSDMDTLVEISREVCGIEGSSMYLKPGEQLTVEQLLYGLMLSSGNDAAVALALETGGTVEQFVEMMNEKAAELGLSGTHFANPNGLDSEENYGTARDLAVLAASAIRNQDFCRIVSTKTYQCPGHSLQNHNKLLWQYDGAIGVKTGFTKHAGRLLVGAAERNGRRLISVTINDGDDWRDHGAMLDYGFSRYREKNILTEDAVVGSLPVISGAVSSVPLVAAGSVSAWTAESEIPALKLIAPMFLYAPVVEGQKIGCVQVYLDDRLLEEVPVCAGASAEEVPEEKSLLQRLRERFQTREGLA